MAPESVRAAFVCAMPMELAPLRRPLSLSAIGKDRPRVYRGRLDGRPVAAVTTGMGPTLARRGVERMLESVGEPERVVVVGITGALCDEPPIGTLVCPERVVDGATGAAYRPAALRGASPSGTMWTTAELLTDPALLEALRAEGVVALDMETAAVGALCDERTIPWSVVRVVSDRADDGSVDQEVFAMSDQGGRPKASSVLSYLARHPGRVPQLARMGRQAREATRRAAEAAVEEVRAAWRAEGR